MSVGYDDKEEQPPKVFGTNKSTTMTDLKATLRIQMPLHKQEYSWNTIASGIVRHLHRFCRNSKNSGTVHGNDSRCSVRN